MRQSLYKLFINFFWNNLFTKNNMRKLLVIFFGLSAVCFSAKLNYTNKSTTSYKGEIIKYAENTEEDYPIFNMLYDSESGMSTPSYWEEALDIDVSSIKVMRVPGMRKENKRYSSTSHHMISMFKSFDMSMGGNYVKNNPDSVVMTTGVIPGKMPRGIISLSTYAHAGSSGFLGSNSFFFGDVINELSGGFHQSPRLIGVTSDNTNLYIGTFGNDSTIESENRMSGDDIPVIHPSQETFYFPMFGEEVQKMSRSDNIRVKDFTCGNMFHSSKRLPDIRGIDGPTEIRQNENCAINDKHIKGKYPFYALYTKANTIVADGEVNAGGKLRNGSSFAVPRVAGLITKIMQKFPGISYIQAKHILLTTARRDEDKLDSYIGWGIADEKKALSGPSALNAGLIEEQKFYTGMYDKIYDYNGNIYFWAEPETDWIWTNDIYGNFAEHPTGTLKYDIATNTADADGDIIQSRLAFKTMRDVTFKEYIPSERNYYTDTAQFRPGLRKAGKATLTLTGDLYYTGPTQVLEGKIVIKGNVPYSSVIIYEGAEAEIYGNVNTVILAGGHIKLKEGSGIGTLEVDQLETSAITIPNEGDGIYLKKVLIKSDRIDDLKEIVATNPNNVVESYEANRKENSIYDVNVNLRKYQDLKREYFMSDFKSSIIKIEADTEILNKMRKRYLSLSEAPEEYLEIVPGYSNGNFKFDNAEDNEFLKYNNPISSNDMFELLNNDLIWTNYYDARKAAGL